jgi:alkanesulfonate monooxygenase SsuD/methylene tetrahydromethanopterin reductase-like flavin-dependent oxidoreductase (luciferase family)
LLAKAASTVDAISGGRLTIGIGAGDPTTAEHYDQWGLPFPETPRERVARLEEHLEVQRLLYTRDFSDFNGAYYQLQNAVNEPKPIQKPHPPIWLGLNTSSTVMPRIAAARANGVVVEWGDDEVAGQVVPKLSQACEARGRDPLEVTRARFLCAVVVDGSVRREQVFRELARRSGVYDGSFLEEAWDEWLGTIVGTPEEIRDQLAGRTVDLGFDHVMLHIFSVGLDEADDRVGSMAKCVLAGMRAIAEDVMPAFR